MIFRCVIAVCLLLAGMAKADVIVQSVAHGYSGEQAGLVTGDRISDWQFAEPSTQREALHDAFAFNELSSGSGQRGVVVLLGSRDGQAMEWHLSPGFWSVAVRPDLEPTALEQFESAKSVLGDADSKDVHDQAIQALLDLADDIAEQGATFDRIWMRTELGSILRSQGEVDLARELTREAADEALDLGRPEVAAQILESAGLAHGRHGEMEAAIRNLSAGLEIRLAEGNTPIQAAFAYRSIGIATSAASQFDESIASSTQAVTLFRQEIPASLYLAEGLHTLGNALFWSGDIAAAEPVYVEALEIRRKQAPESVYVARSSGVLGNVYWRLGNLDQAQALYQDARRLYQASGAAPQYLAQTILSEGFIAHDRRDLASADRFYIKALEMLKEHDPGSNAEASVYLAMGNTARVRSDLTAAQAHYINAQQRYERIAKDSQRVALVTFNRAQVALSQGELDQAHTLAMRSMRILESINPDGILVPNRLVLLGAIALRRGELTLARSRIQHALERFQAVRERSPNVASALYGLGDVALAGGDHAAALAHFTSATAMFDEFAPGSDHLAQAQHKLALTHWRLEQHAEADAAFQASIVSLGEQRARIGGDSESGYLFTTAYADIYRDYVAFLLEGDRAEAAFQILALLRRGQIERLLGEAGVGWRGSLDLDQKAALAQLNYQYEKAYEKLLNATDSTSQSEYQALLQALVTVRAQRSELLDATHSFHTPDRVACGPVATLAWVIRDAGSFLVLCHLGKLEYRALLLTADDLEDRIHRLRILMQVPGASPASEQAMHGLARELYRDLVAPIASHLDGIGHLTLVPDGPLWRLPFAALVSGGGNNAPRYWIQDLSLSVTPLVRNRASGEREFSHLVALADPVAPEGSDWIARRRSAGALPHAALEAHAIGELFKDSAIHIGAAASESRIKTLSAPDVLHLATHGVLDPRRAMDSYLLLSPDMDGENGLLQAWEVHEQLDLTTRLVTLSACDTAPGAGSGLLGLTWAFHAAGGEQVLATLWPVEDQSTSELMQTFYQYLLGGEGAGISLARAQRAIANDSGMRRHPYYWAGFQLSQL